MANALLNIIKKEVKEILRDPRLFIGMILVPILIFPIMGIVMKFSMQSIIQESRMEGTIAILNLDQGEFSSYILNNQDLILALEKLNISIIDLQSLKIYDLNTAINFIKKSDKINSLVVIPENFTESISNQSPARIEIYVNIETLGFNAIGMGEKAYIFIDILDQFIKNLFIVKYAPNINPRFMQNPTILSQNIIYMEEVIRGVSPQILTSTISTQLFMLPIVTLILVMLAIQFAAITIASEKEEKTLETLLSLPVNRTMLLIGKLTGAIVISIVGFIGFMIGFQFYITTTFSIISDIPISMEEIVKLGPKISVQGYLLLGSNILLSLLASLSIAVVLAAFAEDVRTAQSLVSIIYFPMLLGYFGAIMTLGASTNSIGMLLLTIPFTSPMISCVLILQGKLINVLIGNLGILAETILFIYLAAKFYASEKILTVRLRLRRKIG